jgi:hypothetical protein
MSAGMRISMNPNLPASRDYQLDSGGQPQRFLTPLAHPTSRIQSGFRSG